MAVSSRRSASRAGTGSAGSEVVLAIIAMSVTQMTARL